MPKLHHDLLRVWTIGSGIIFDLPRVWMPLAWTATRLSNSFSIRAGIIFIRLRVWKVPAGIIFVRLRVWKVPAGIIFVRLRVWMPFAETATRPSKSLDSKCRNCNTTFVEYQNEVPEWFSTVQQFDCWVQNAGMITDNAFFPPLPVNPLEVRKNT